MVSCAFCNRFVSLSPPHQCVVARLILLKCNAWSDVNNHCAGTTETNNTECQLYLEKKRYENVILEKCIAWNLVAAYFSLKAKFFIVICKTPPPLLLIVYSAPTTLVSLLCLEHIRCSYLKAFSGDFLPPDIHKVRFSNLGSYSKLPLSDIFSHSPSSPHPHCQYSSSFNSLPIIEPYFLLCKGKKKYLERYI